MRIATFNIQNLFHRHLDLIEMGYEVKFEVWREEFEGLLLKEQRTVTDYSRMRELAELLGFHKSSHEPYLSMKNIDGSLYVKSAMKVKQWKASYLTDWNGWIKLRSVPLSKNAVINKAKVIFDIDADIVLLQEVENRESLAQFNEAFFKGNQKSNYRRIMHIQGNDATDLGMGILLKEGYHIKSVKSFSNERDELGKLLFNVDFHQYKIKTPNNKTLYILCCQLAGEDQSDSSRKKQANKVAEVYEGLRLKGKENIVILGTLNVPSYSGSICPIMETGVKDVVTHTSFSVLPDTGADAGYFRMGAYRKGVNIRQKDYLLVSLALFEKIKGCGMNRKGMWPLNKPEWETYDSMKNERDSASDHPLLWAELALEDSLRLLKKSA